MAHYFKSTRSTLQLSAVCIGNNLFRLNYIVTIVILLALSLLVPGRQCQSAALSSNYSTSAATTGATVGRTTTAGRGHFKKEETAAYATETSVRSQEQHHDQLKAKEEIKLEIGIRVTSRETGLDTSSDRSSPWLDVGDDGHRWTLRTVAPNTHMATDVASEDATDKRTLEQKANFSTEAVTSIAGVSEERRGNESDHSFEAPDEGMDGSVIPSLNNLVRYPSTTIAEAAASASSTGAPGRAATAVEAPSLDTPFRPAHAVALTANDTEAPSKEQDEGGREEDAIGTGAPDEKERALKPSAQGSAAGDAEPRETLVRSQIGRAKEDRSDTKAQMTTTNPKLRGEDSRAQSTASPSTARGKPLHATAAAAAAVVTSKSGPELAAAKGKADRESLDYSTSTSRTTTTTTASATANSRMTSFGQVYLEKEEEEAAYTVETSSSVSSSSRVVGSLPTDSHLVVKMTSAADTADSHGGSVGSAITSVEGARPSVLPGGQTSSQANSSQFPLTTTVADEPTSSKQFTTLPGSTAVDETTTATDDENATAPRDKAPNTSSTKAPGSTSSFSWAPSSSSSTTTTTTVSSSLSTRKRPRGEKDDDVASSSAPESERVETNDDEQVDDSQAPGEDGATAVVVVVGGSDAGGSDEDTVAILPHRQCAEERVIDVNWNLTDAGVLALKACPDPYAGSVYRACYSSGTWGTPDYSECRLPHLREVQNLIFYHIHKYLYDGLPPLVENLRLATTSEALPIKSPMDRLDAIDALNAVLRAKIKIRIGEEDDKDISLINSLISTVDHILTGIKVKFSVETEKNALITTKLAETVSGLRLLAENLLRALIVSCNEGTIRRLKPINPNTENLVFSLTHRMPYGGPLVPLTSSSTLADRAKDAPQVTVHLEDFKKLGVGISFVWVRGLGSELNNLKYELISDVILVSVLPAMSIEVDFEETPKAEIELFLKRHLSANDVVRCARIKSPGDIWDLSGCYVIGRNDSWLRCRCSEMGAFGAVLQHSFDVTSTGRRTPFKIHKLLLCASSGLGVLFLVVTLACKLMSCRRSERPSCREGSFVLVNLLVALTAIQMIFLLGAPFRDSRLHHQPGGAELYEPEHSSSNARSTFFHALSRGQLCNITALLLHYLHLAVGFWMLSHSIFLYQRLWRPIASEEEGNSQHSPHHSSSNSAQAAGEFSSEGSFFSSSDSSQAASNLPRSKNLPGCCRGFCCCCRGRDSPRGPARWGLRTFAFFAWIVPLLILLVSYIFNPTGYETRRYCWMSIEGGMVVSFIVPISLLIMTNTVVMLLVLKRFFAHKPVTHKAEIEKTEPSLRAGVTLLPFFAVNWFLSVLALEDTATTAFQYIFALSNAVHCFLVFLFLVYQKQDLRLLLQKHVFSPKKRSEKSIMRLKANHHHHAHHHPCRGLRVDFPRQCLGDSTYGSASALLGGYSTTSDGQETSHHHHQHGDEHNQRNSNVFGPSDSQPLLMPYSCESSAGDLCQASTSSGSGHCEAVYDEGEDSSKQLERLYAN